MRGKVYHPNTLDIMSQEPLPWWYQFQCWATNSTRPWSWKLYRFYAVVSCFIFGHMLANDGVCDRCNAGDIP